MSLYAVIRGRGPAWDASRPMREQDGWAEHAVFMDALADEGFVVIGGPRGPDRTFLLIVTAAAEDTVRERLAQDPWSASGQLRVDSVEPWRILLGEDRLARLTMS